MKVFDLIEKLKKFDLNAEVKFIDENSVAKDVEYHGFGYSDGCTIRDCEEVYLSCPDYNESIEK